MTIVHVVLFEFKPNTTHKQVHDVCNRMLGLGQKCVHPDTQKKYIKSARGGRDNSPEGHQGGFSHGFVFEFENEDDRKYYLEKDPAHLDFVKDVGTFVQNVRVIDFTTGIL
ncbi:dabb-domain-containing protein [Viridothelium virens]|uniref:Dabb-domain-containing protein n=1 Tax=Viridothelium virens TaxID=1048519 RepID=A0A6A6HEY0_VIRVR|nr:dabb-domain-containing protein [Viridothelium virens]